MDNEKLMELPYSDSGKRLLSYVTNGFYEKSYMAKWIYQVIGNEFDTAKYSIEDIVNQFFLETATWGLAYHEEKWGLPIQDKLSYELRRQLIKQKKNQREAKTPFMIEKYIRSVTDCNCYICDIHDNPIGKSFEHPNLFYLILFSDESKHIDTSVIRKILNEQKQSHTDYIINERLAFFLYNKEFINLEHLIISLNIDLKNNLNNEINHNNKYSFKIDYLSHLSKNEEFYTWYLDGKSLLNGSKEFDAHLINTDAPFKNIYEYNFWNKSYVSSDENKITFNSSFNNENLIKSNSKIKICINSDNERFNYDYREKRKTWRFNGEFKLDGNHKLNSIFKEDENGF